MIDTTGSSPIVTHTLGLSERFGCPELMIVGADPDLANSLIGYIVSQIVELGRNFIDGQQVPLPLGADPGSAPLIIKDALASQLEAFPLVAAHAYYPNNTGQFQQVVMADHAGKFPWEDGCEPLILASQRMFWHEDGVRAVAPHFFNADGTVMKRQITEDPDEVFGAPADAVKH